MFLLDSYHFKLEQERPYATHGSLNVARAAAFVSIALPPEPPSRSFQNGAQFHARASALLNVPDHRGYEPVAHGDLGIQRFGRAKRTTQRRCDASGADLHTARAAF